MTIACPEQGVRGQAIACLSAGGGPPWRIVTYATVSRAIYAVYDETPNDENVVRTIAQGLTLDEYEAAAPDDVLAWLRDYFNTFHAGVTITFAEVFGGAMEK